MSKTISGIHIQWPWSQLITRGEKSIETRGYPIPKKHLNVPLALIETPGPRGKKEGNIARSKIIALITFNHCFRYKNKTHWIKDYAKHLVRTTDPHFAFDPQKEKWGWVIEKVVVLSPPKPPPKKRGLIFASDCRL